MLCGDGRSDYVTLIGKVIISISWSCGVSSQISPHLLLSMGNLLYIRGFMFSWWLSVKTRLLQKIKKHVSVTGCFTIPFLCFPFCHFSIILGISVRQALFLKLPLFHRFLYFMISTSSSSVVQTEVEAWGNQAATMTCKPQAGSCGTCMICQFS